MKKKVFFHCENGGGERAPRITQPNIRVLFNFNSQRPTWRKYGQISNYFYLERYFDGFNEM